MSSSVSFAEHSCWNGDDFRHVRKPVYFRLVTSDGEAVDVLADYGIWYHTDDEALIALLEKHSPGGDWGRFVYHRDWRFQSGIDVCDPEDDSLVARLEVRQYRGSGLDELDTDVGENVVRMADWRTSRKNTEPVETTELLLTEILPE